VAFGADKFYCVDTTDRQTHQPAHHQRDEAPQIVEAKNNSERQPVLNLQIAKAYLAGSDNGITTRTWQHAIEASPTPSREPTRNAGEQQPKTRHWFRCCRVIIENQRANCY
jgi:hypothetical protein